ncbi:MAG: peptide deformylase [Gammaproteobacteria bacterium]
MGRLRQIAQLGSPVLRQKADAIDVYSDVKLKSIIRDMLATLVDSNGVGIAAPQIYESYRIVIVASRPTLRYPTAPAMEPVVMINPAFEPVTQQREKDWEGCLSIPGIRALVPRFRKIAVAYFNPEGNPLSLKLEGFPARIFQHEFDHLEGMVYLDRVEDNREIVSEKEYLKLMQATK